MSFTPTTAQLELFAELEMALGAVRNFEEPPPSGAKIMRRPLVEREHELLMIAERMFEGE